MSIFEKTALDLVEKRAGLIRGLTAFTRPKRPWGRFAFNFNIESYC